MASKEIDEIPRSTLDMRVRRYGVRFAVAESKYFTAFECHRIGESLDKSAWMIESKIGTSIALVKRLHNLLLKILGKDHGAVYSIWGKRHVLTKTLFEDCTRLRVRRIIRNFSKSDADAVKPRCRRTTRKVTIKPPEPAYFWQRHVEPSKFIRIDASTNPVSKNSIYRRGKSPFKSAGVSLAEAVDGRPRFLLASAADVTDGEPSNELNSTRRCAACHTNFTNSLGLGQHIRQKHGLVGLPDSTAIPASDTPMDASHGLANQAVSCGDEDVYESSERNEDGRETAADVGVEAAGAPAGLEPFMDRTVAHDGLSKVLSVDRDTAMGAGADMDSNEIEGQGRTAVDQITLGACAQEVLQPSAEISRSVPSATAFELRDAITRVAATAYANIENGCQNGESCQPLAHVLPMADSIEISAMDEDGSHDNSDALLGAAGELDHHHVGGEHNGAIGGTSTMLHHTANQYHAPQPPPAGHNSPRPAESDASQCVLVAQTAVDADPVYQEAPQQMFQSRGWSWLSSGASRFTPAPIQAEADSDDDFELRLELEEESDQEDSDSGGPKIKLEEPTEFLVADLHSQGQIPLPRQDSPPSLPIAPVNVVENTGPSFDHVEAPSLDYPRADQPVDCTNRDNDNIHVARSEGQDSTINGDARDLEIPAESTNQDTVMVIAKAEPIDVKPLDQQPFLAAAYLETVGYTPDAVNPFRCRDCKLSFKNRYQLTKHRRSQHGSGNLACRYCPVSFTNSYQLTKHHRSHHGISCVCGKYFSPRGMALHKKTCTQARVDFEELHQDQQQQPSCSYYHGNQ